MHVQFIHKALVAEDMDVVRGTLRHKGTGEIFEMVGVDRGNNEIVPLFLVPMRGAQALVEEYEVLRPDEANVNEAPASHGGAIH
jgi:hypothetical protein